MMLVGILTPVRLLGEAIAAALVARNAHIEVEVVRELEALRVRVSRGPRIGIVVVDTTLLTGLDEIRAFHLEFPRLPLLALGLREKEAEVIAHGSAGFACYLRREEGLDALCTRIEDALAGRLPCSPEIAAAMMRGLFRQSPFKDTAGLPPLTRREDHVAGFISRGLSNKEIARELRLSESTVKHHVHNILAKCRLSTRLQLMRQMRQDIWTTERSSWAEG